MDAEHSLPDDSGHNTCPAVSSSVNYLGDMDVRPVFYAQQRQRDNLVLETRTVDIYDARSLKEAPSLESNGFTLVSHATAVRDFTAAEEAQEVYRPEIEELILQLTGAEKVIVLNTLLRWSEPAGDKSAFVNSHPARFVAYSIWRVLTPPPQDVPLAVCDARTTSLDDVTVGDAVIDAPDKPERRFESSLYHVNPRHRWFWFSDMRPDEALVFKAFDSELDRVQGCPHSAFDHPDCPPDVPPRASAEIRAFAFY